MDTTVKTYAAAKRMKFVIKTLDAYRLVSELLAWGWVFLWRGRFFNYQVNKTYIFFINHIVIRLIDWIFLLFYAVSATFSPYNDGDYY